VIADDEGISHSQSTTWMGRTILLALSSNSGSRVVGREGSLMRKLVLASVAALVLSVLVPAATSATPTLETVRTAQGDTVVFDNVRHTADLSLASSGWVNFAPRLDANGVLACPPAGDYGYAKSQATNAYGQTLKWAFYVGFNGDCGLFTMRVRFRMHLVCSGNVLAPWCNFDSDNAALMEKYCNPFRQCAAHIIGNKNFHSVLGTKSAWFTGVWHPGTGSYSYMSSDNHFHVHFRNPDHQGTDHAGCSHWVWFPDRVEGNPSPCSYASP
jgi:hypothetical protein